MFHNGAPVWEWNVPVYTKPQGKGKRWVKAFCRPVLHGYNTRFEDGWTVPPSACLWRQKDLLMELVAHYTSNEIVLSLAIFAAGVISGVLLAWAARARDKGSR